MSEPLKVGVVGMGIRGIWISEMTRAGDATELVALADFDESKLDIVKLHFPDASLYASGERMACEADIDAVFVGTGDRFHAGNAIEALQAGKHVLVEKPLAQNFGDISEIVRLKQETGLTVGTFLELRHATLWQRVMELIQSGEIGTVLAGALVDHVGRDKAQFFGRSATRSRDGVVSLVLQKGVHALDLLNWFMGSSPRKLHAVGGLRHFGGEEPEDKHCHDCADKDTCPHFHERVGKLATPPIEMQADDDFCVWSRACDVEDVTFANIAYDSGAVATYSEVHFAPHYSIHMTIYGSKAQLDIDANHDTGESWIDVTARHTHETRREQPADN
ncbi:MAG TPA: Gfo/Idh/MocA family oxidoreductase, partial [Armatimonadota bacterium]|nr:Gfo/Idh/MocA family oxidoreductase [Armatimonadota bacterium]